MLFLYLIDKVLEISKEFSTLNPLIGKSPLVLSSLASEHEKSDDPDYPAIVFGFKKRRTRRVAPAALKTQEE
jgi:hypothetical protein